MFSTKVGFGMSNLQASLRRTSSCPFRGCCSRWARDPNMKISSKRIQFDLIQVQEDNAKNITWRMSQVWCLPSRMTWAMLSALLSRGSLKFCILKSQVTKPIWRGACSEESQTVFDVVCSKFSLSILVLFDDFKGCWSCAAQSWRRVSSRNYWNWQRTTWHAKVPRFQFKRSIICGRGQQPILLTESGICMVFRFGISSFLSTKLSWRQV